MKTTKLTSEHHILKNYLIEHFISGHYYSIEEIVEKVRYDDDTPLFKLNTNPYTHDKCFKLSKMVKELNWATNVKRYIPIVKDKFGGIKLAENKSELEGFIKDLKHKVENANKYANHLQSLIDLQDTIPFINLANRVKTESEMKPIEIYAKE